MTAPQIADALGRKNIADALKVGPTAVSNAVVRGAFPASWYVTIAFMCEKEGLPCPPSLFGMRGTEARAARAASARKGAA